jgi:hypothetical protein
MQNSVLQHIKSQWPALRLWACRYTLPIQRQRHSFWSRSPGSFFRELLFLAKSFRVAKSLDLLVLCSGGFKWGFARQFVPDKILFCERGSGPLDHPVKRALADYVSFRDDKSRTLIRQIGFKGRAQVVADNVYSLKIPRLNINTSQGDPCRPCGGGDWCGMEPFSG